MKRELGMSHDGSLVLTVGRTLTTQQDAAVRRLVPSREREQLRAELLRRIVAREEERQHLRRMPR